MPVNRLQFLLTIVENGAAWTGGVPFDSQWNNLFAQGNPGDLDTTAHSIQFVAVEDNVKLEVLDWGGSGRPIILLHGGNRTAHDFDKFAPKLTAFYHV